MEQRWHFGPLTVLSLSFGGGVGEMAGCWRARQSLSRWSSGLPLSANHVVSSGRLIEKLWGKRCAGVGTDALQVRVSQPRRHSGVAACKLREALALWHGRRSPMSA
jgi:hypothetical protein